MCVCVYMTYLSCTEHTALSHLLCVAVPDTPHGTSYNTPPHTPAAPHQCAHTPTYKQNKKYPSQMQLIRHTQAMCAK